MRAVNNLSFHKFLGFGSVGSVGSVVGSVGSVGSSSTICRTASPTERKKTSEKKLTQARKKITDAVRQPSRDCKCKVKMSKKSFKVPRVPTATEAPLPIIEGVAVMSIRDSDEESQSSRGRVRVREPSSRSQYRSLSPRNRPDEAREEFAEELDGNEHLQRIDPEVILEMVVGAEVAEWFELINELKVQESEGIQNDPPSVAVLNALKKFTNLPIDLLIEAGALLDPEAKVVEETKYTETIFNKEFRAYLKVYTGNGGGKFFFNKVGDKKYLASHQRDKVVIKNVEATDVKDFNPKLANSI